MMNFTRVRTTRPNDEARRQKIWKRVVSLESNWLRKLVSSGAISRRLTNMSIGVGTFRIRNGDTREVCRRFCL